MTEGILKYELTIPPDALDENEHVNNVVYLQWMQDVAIMHFTAMGGNEVMHKLGASWFAREHNIKYLSPAFEGEEIAIFTWVANLHRARSMRRYMFVRKSDNKTLAKGETDWVFVDAKTGRPKIIPDEITALFTPISEEEQIIPTSYCDFSPHIL